MVAQNTCQNIDVIVLCALLQFSLWKDVILDSQSVENKLYFDSEELIEKKIRMETYLWTSESVGEGHPGLLLFIL